MKLGRRVTLLAALAGIAVLGLFAFGGTPAVATETHPDGTVTHHECTWSVSKSADHYESVQFVGQEPFNVLYTVVISATCASSHHLPDGTHHAHHRLDGAPDHVANECVNVADTFAGGPNRQVCLSDLTNGQLTIRYERTFGPFAECGDVSYTNVVTLSDLAHEAHPNGHVLASDDATVVFHVLCDRGCTLTQGYWKTHSREGPAPYDEAWKNLGALEEDTPFFSSGMTWYQTFWTPPAGGNAWLILAHQYMAAKLNILNGASTTASVSAAITWAESFFATYLTPSATLSKSVRNAALARAATLDQYNNGLAPGGPPHCDEAHTHVV